MLYDIYAEPFGCRTPLSSRSLKGRPVTCPQSNTLTGAARDSTHRGRVSAAVRQLNFGLLPACPLPNSTTRSADRGMSLILAVPTRSPSRNLLMVDNDDNTETDSFEHFPHAHVHSNSPTESPISLQKPIHVVGTEPFDSYYPDAPAFHSDPGSFLLKPDQQCKMEQEKSNLEKRKRFRFPKV